MNLFICLTPLQMLIAQALIRDSGKRADLLVICYRQTDNAKFHHYFHETAALCRHAEYRLIPQNKWLRPFFLPILTSGLHRHYHTVFAASIDNPNVQYLLSRLAFGHLETFDDGSGNLTPEGALYHNPPPTPAYRLLRVLRRLHYQTEDLRRLSQCHHTLYPDQPNIASPTVPVRLWMASPPACRKQDTAAAAPAPRRILIGQPVFPDAERNRILVQQLLSRCAAAEYFPHPREHYRISGAAYIDTDLIFEDWLLHTLHRQPESRFEIHTFASTAALNAHSFPRTEICTHRPADPLFFTPAYASLYSLMIQLGISVTDWADETKQPESR